MIWIRTFGRRASDGAQMIAPKNRRCQSKNEESSNSNDLVSICSLFGDGGDVVSAAAGVAKG
jgi:hypothetical protein